MQLIITHSGSRVSQPINLTGSTDSGKVEATQIYFVVLQYK